MPVQGDHESGGSVELSLAFEALIFLKILSSFMCKGAFLPYTSASPRLASTEANRGHEILKTGYRWLLCSPYGCWKLNLSPLEEQPAFFNH